MGNVRVRVPGTGGKIEARALRMRNAVAAELERADRSRRNRFIKRSRIFAITEK
jgi:hypothetical protein